MLYVITVETFPERNEIGSMGEFFYRDKAEAVARKHSRDMGPNLVVVMTAKNPDGTVKSRKAWRYGRVYSLRRT